MMEDQKAVQVGQQRRIQTVLMVGTGQRQFWKTGAEAYEGGADWGKGR